MQESIENWISRFGDIPIPVLAHTIKTLSKRCNEDVPILDLVELVETDPGLTVQLIRTCSLSSQGSLRSEVTSVQQALMMLGIEQLKKLPEKLPTVESTLKGSAKQHLLRTFSIANHAARQSTVWARQRRDMMPDEVTAATLLHFIGEMLISIHAPNLVDDIYKMRNEEHIPSDEAQYIVLGFTFDQLSLVIAERWHLPSLLVEALHAENANHPRAYSIMLAVQLARHAAINWYSSKMRTLLDETAEWLDKPISVLIKETHQLAVAVARDTEFYNITPAAALLLADNHETEAQENPAQPGGSTNSHTGICLIPQIAVMKDIVNKLKSLPSDTKDLRDIINITMEGLHDGVGLNRVVFAIYEKTVNTLTAYSIAGADNDPLFGQFNVNMDQQNLFTYMSGKIQAVWINDTNYEQYAALIPEQLSKITLTNNFFCMSVVLQKRLYGLFYADRHTTDCHLDKNAYNFFKAICMQAVQTMQRMSGLHH